MSRSSMIEQVDALIGNLLLNGRAVVLPETGTLLPMRQGARFEGRRSLLPPGLHIEFSSTAPGELLAEAIVRIAACSDEQAHDICMRWLAAKREAAGEEGAIEIGGVGRLKQKSFVVDPAFDARLNPAGHEPVRLPRRRDGWLRALVCLAALSAGVAVLCALHLSGVVTLPFAGNGDGRTADVRATAPGTPAAAEDGPSVPELPATDSSAPTSDGAAQGLAEATGRNASERTEATEAVGSLADSAPAASAGSSSAASARPADPVAADPASRSATPSAADEIGRSVSGRHYVVLGIFSTEANARRAVADALRRDPENTCRIYLYGEHYMVSLFESADAEQARQFARAHRSVFRDLWVYAKR